jgi:hypothetical protein
MTVTRVRYRERQFLRAADLSDEQAYRIAMRRRHNIAHHGWGIVTGLEMALEEDTVVVKPGMAVDGYGRELIVPRPVPVPMTICDGDDILKVLGDAIDVWLVYNRAAETPPQRGRWECGPGRHSRWREEALLHLTAAGSIDPRLPATAPEADLDFGPHETLPDDPAREWPVYLGRITKDSSQDVPTYEVDLSNRPYVTLIGETVNAPSGRARMQVGSEAAGDRRRFAVSLPDEAGTFVDRLVIDQYGDTTVQGDTVLGGDLILVADEAGVETRSVPNIIFEPMPALLEVARPWQIYHTAVSQENVSGHQLRLEIGHPADKDDPGSYSLVIGREIGCGGFDPYLIVWSDGTVGLPNDKGVIVEGQVTEGPIQLDPDDPHFGELEEKLTDLWLHSLAKAGERVDLFYAADLHLQLSELDPPRRVEAGTSLVYSFSVSNAGASAITDIQLFEIVTIGDDVVSQRPIGDIAILNPAATHSGFGRYDVPANESLIGQAITVEVMARWPSAGTVAQVSSKKVALIASSSLVIEIDQFDDPFILNGGSSYQYRVTARNTGTEDTFTIELVGTLTVIEESPDVQEIGTYVLGTGDAEHIPVTHTDIKFKRAWIGKRLMVAAKAEGTGRAQIDGEPQTVEATGASTALIDAGNIEIGLAVSDLVVISEQTWYTITVTNTSLGTVTDVRVYATLRTPQETIVDHEEVRFITALDIGASEEIQVPFPSDELSGSIDRDLTVEITAEGFRQAGSEVQTGPVSETALVDAGNLEISEITLLSPSSPPIIIGGSMSYRAVLRNPGPYGRVTVDKIAEVVNSKIIGAPGGFNIELDPGDEHPEERTWNIPPDPNLIGENLTIVAYGQRQAGSEIMASSSEAFLIDGGNLKIVSIEVLVPRVVGQTMRYMVTLENDGFGQVSDILLTEIIAIGETQSPVRPIEFPSTLVPGQSESITVEYEIPGESDLIGQELTVTVKARGNRQAGSALPEQEISSVPPVIINGGVLQFELSLPDTVTAGVTMSYSIQVTNPETSIGRVVDVTFNESISLAGTLRRTEEFSLPSPLERGDRLTIQRTYPVLDDATGQLNVQVTAQGRTAWGNVTVT